MNRDSLKDKYDDSTINNKSFYILLIFHDYYSNNLLALSTHYLFPTPYVLALYTCM